MMFKSLFLNGKRTFYYKLITSLLIISLLPVFLISVLSYYYTEKTLKDEMVRANTTNLYQAVNAIEIIMRQINDGFRQLAFDPAFNDFVNFPSGLYYEEIRGELSQDDLPVLTRYLENKSRVFHRISILKRSNEFITSVYLLDNKKDILLTDGGLQYSADEFYDNGWYELAQSTIASPIFMDTRQVEREDGVKLNALTVIYKSYTSYLSSDYTIVVNLDADKIYKSIIRALDHQSRNIFYVETPSGKKIFGESVMLVNEEALKVEKLGVESEIRTGWLELDSGRRQMLSTAIKSDMLNWKFTILSDLSNLYRGIAFTKLAIFISALSLAVVIIVISIISSRRIYSPIEKIMTYIDSRSRKGLKESDNVSPKEELMLIASSLKEAFEQSDALQEKLEQSLPAFKEKFVFNLLKGNDLRDIDERIAFLGLDLESTNLTAMAIYPMDAGNSDNVRDVLIEKLNIKDFVEKFVGRSYKGVVVENDEGRIVVIVNCLEQEKGKLFKFAEELKDALYMGLGVTCAVGIGKHAQYIIKLRESYSEAVEALRYSAMAGGNDVVYIDDIRISDIQSFTYPQEKENTLCSFIKNGDNSNAQRTFFEFTKEIALQNRNMPPYQRQQVFIHLMSSIIRVTYDIGFDLRKVLPNETDIFAVLHYKSELEVIQWFKKFIESVTECIAKEMVEKSNKHVDNIIGILKGKSGLHVSLSSVAEELNLNPAYVSRIFKEHTGKTFTEYLTWLRMEESKGLLLQTNLMIKDVAEKVGYNNSHYFIKLFREHTGTTPGEYRNISNI